MQFKFSDVSLRTGKLICFNFGSFQFYLITQTPTTSFDSVFIVVLSTITPLQQNELVVFSTYSRGMTKTIHFNIFMCSTSDTFLLFYLPIAKIMWKIFSICFYSQKFEKNYKREEQETGGNVAVQTQFEYAYCLVRSEYPADIKKVCFLHPNGQWLRRA